MMDQASSLRRMSGARTAAASPAARPAQRTAPRPHGTARSIAVTSGKGGVGKTNISLFLSMALASLHKNVLLFDADLGLANVHILLGQAPAHTLADVAAERCDIRDVLLQGPQGIDIIPGASGIRHMADMDALGLGKLQRSLASLDRDYDFIVMDTAAGIGSITTTFAARADIDILVFTPEPTSFTDAYAMAKTLYEEGADSIAGIVNMVRSDTEGHTTFDKLSTLVVQFLQKELKLLGIVPYDKTVPAHVRKQHLYDTALLRHPVYRRVLACARRLCGLPVPAHHGFFARLFAAGPTRTQEGTS
jgi:flagellar biosynthesis protein FlhG